MKRVVVADDHPLFRSAVCAHLRAIDGVQIVGEAQDGLDALSKCFELHPDLTIMDIALQRRDGLAVIREIHAWPRAPKIIVLTAHANVFMALRCFRAGAHGFVPKTASSDELVRAVEVALSGRRYVPPDMIHDVTSHLLDHGGEVDPIESLTARELEVLRLIAAGAKNREIGGYLGISARTVDTHRSNLLKKLGLRNNADLTRVAMHFGLVQAWEPRTMTGPSAALERQIVSDPV